MPHWDSLHCPQALLAYYFAASEEHSKGVAGVPEVAQVDLSVGCAAPSSVLDFRSFLVADVDLRVAAFGEDQARGT